MFNKKEIVLILITIIISAFIYSLHKAFNLQNDIISIALTPLSFILGLIIFLVIILVNTIVKKLAADHFNMTIEYKIWEFQRTGWERGAKLKKPFPIGLVLPFTLSLISIGIIECFTFLQFEVKNNPVKRLLRKRGLYRKTEINESDPAFTVAWGSYALLLLSLVAIAISMILKPLGIIFFNLELSYPLLELAKYSIFYGFWNLLPVSNLDGTKLFFGSLLNWIILAVLFVIAAVLVIIFI